MADDNDRPEWYVRAFEPPKSYYAIEPDEEDARYVTLTIVGDIHVYPIEDGKKEYDYEVYELPGIRRFDGLEENVREHYFVWLAHARAYTLTCDRLHAELDRAMYAIARSALSNDDTYQ
jgi:hypothetical protein